MPKFAGVYEDTKGRWYFKVSLGRDPLTGRRVQVTKRGFATAYDASRARRWLLDSNAPVSRSVHLTVDELLDMYLDGVDADSSLAAKTRFDYRSASAAWVRPWMGKHKVKEVTPDVIVKWQRKLAESGGVKGGKPLSGSSGFYGVHRFREITRPSPRRAQRRRIVDV